MDTSSSSTVLDEAYCRENDLVTKVETTRNLALKVLEDVLSIKPTPISP